MYDLLSKPAPSIAPDSTPEDRLAHTMTQNLKPLDYLQELQDIKIQLKRLDELERSANEAEHQTKLAEAEMKLAHERAEFAKYQAQIATESANGSRRRSIASIVLSAIAIVVALSAWLIPAEFIRGIFF